LYTYFYLGRRGEPEGGGGSRGIAKGGKLKAIGCAGKSRNDFFTLENNSKSESLLENIGKSELQKLPPVLESSPSFENWPDWGRIVILSRLSLLRIPITSIPP
jgi:hypothetical protein